MYSPLADHLSVRANCMPPPTFDTDDRPANPDVVAGLPAPERPGKIRLHGRTAAEYPALFAPIGPGIETDIGAGPVIPDYRRHPAILDAASAHGGELVAQACVDAPAFDIVADAIVAADIAEPAGVAQHSRRAQGKLTICADSPARLGRQRNAVDVVI